jgi:hypothetical protein
MLFLRNDLNEVSFGFSQREMVSAHPVFDRIAERCCFEHLNLDTAGNAHVHQAAAEFTCAADTLDNGFLSWMEFIQRRHASPFCGIG